ncbi:Dipeptidyl aminopeptidase 4 [Pseudocercospora fuligena]|uniref:dipeptidyl-peptidase IV n=1 Tax=Pseudocercospora fuligena TaxID=685502 RepID=A0A8H6RHC8_9PEZI|nr:Dipeptidyl aminopeptidase 4 [Pseudocercospora fuligena]
MLRSPVGELPPKKADAAGPDLYIKDYNVYLGDTKLSSSGTANSTFDEENIWPSADGKFAVVYQITRPGINRTVTLVESSPPEQVQPKLHVDVYYKPGDDLDLVKPRLFDLEKKKQIDVGPEIYDNPFEIDNADWSFDDKTYRFFYNERGHQLVRLLEVNREGKVRILVEERADTFIDWTNKKMWVRGFNMVKGQDPYYMHLAVVNLDGSNFTVLTQNDVGYHRFEWKPDFKEIEDRWSTISQPMKGVLRDRNGTVLKPLEERVEDKLMDNVTLSTIETFNSTGRDGNTMIYGTILKPRNFDSSKRYPVFEYVYAGPQDFYVIKELGLPDQKDLSYFQKQADDLQVIVVQADGMGTNWRGKTFHDVCHKDLKDAGFEDRIAWIKAAARTRPWMNLDIGVAIYGTSAGGQNALAGLLWHGDFYKAAIADAGCHDNRMDKIWWNEQWMGYPVDNSYAESSNVVHAGRLEGKLLLLVGELDVNVDPSSTMQVVNALNEAGKDYELLVVPGAGHGILRPGWVDVPNVQTLVNGFWKRWLDEVK